MVEARVRLFDKNIYLIERPLDPGDPAVVAVLLVGDERAALVDTLTCPADMAPVRDLLRHVNRPLVVINTHADWDHCWGNCAFPDAPLVGHAVCRERLLAPEASRELGERQIAQPEWFGSVTLRAPWITFSDMLEVELGGLTVVLHHLPGHTGDCLVAHVPGRRLLLAGDCAEDPLPLVGDPTHTARWARELRRWAGSDLETVVPAHGAPAGRPFLAANAAYLEALLAGTPVEPPADATPFYRQAHLDNKGAVEGVPQS